MTATNPYFDDVLSTHVLIRAWLSGEAAAENCAQLLARFSPAFHDGGARRQCGSITSA